MTDRIQFTEEIHKNKLASSEPACMLERPDTQPGRPNLTEEEAKEAKTELINSNYLKLNFPRAVKLRHDPPLAQQNYCLFTFIPSKGATPDKDNCFGVMKIRGTFPTPSEAEDWAENLIRNVDSYNENIIGYVGKDFPITLDSKFCLSTKEVDIRMKMDSVMKENIKGQREQDKKEMEEIQERQRQLLADTSELKETSTDDLEYYTSLRVKRANIRILQEECEKKLKECAKILKKTTSEINELDERFPEYIKEYQQKYRAALDSIGGDIQGNKMLEYMK